MDIRTEKQFDRVRKRKKQNTNFEFYQVGNKQTVSKNGKSREYKIKAVAATEEDIKIFMDETGRSW